MSRPERLKALAQLTRLPAGFTAASNILAAQFIASGGNPVWPEALLLVLASLALYHAGMVLNDCFDFATDARERPARPLPAGLFPRRGAWLLGWGLLLGGLAAAAAAGPRALAVATLLAALVVAYDGFFKGTRLGPLAMAACRYTNWLLGFSLVALGTEQLLLALPIGLYIVGVTTLGRQETGTPARVGIAMAALALAAAMVVILVLWWRGTLSFPWLPLVILPAGGYLLWRHLRLMIRGDAGAVRGLMTVLILGVIPLDALLVLGAGLPWQALAVLALLVPARLLARAIYVT